MHIGEGRIHGHKPVVCQRTTTNGELNGRSCTDIQCTLYRDIGKCNGAPNLNAARPRGLDSSEIQPAIGVELDEAIFSNKRPVAES